MKPSLAVFAPQIGVRSETFIRRHIVDLCPGRTAVVAGTESGSDTGYWNVDCPKLLLDKIETGGLKRQVVRAVARKLGWNGNPCLNAVRRFLEAHRVSVILGEYLDCSLPWFPLAQDMGIRFYGHAHGYDVSLTLRDHHWRSEYLKYNKADGIVAVSQTSKSRLVELGIDGYKIHVIPCGVDVPDKPSIRSEREIVRCVAVGRMVAKKAPILTLDSFRRAVEVFPRMRLDYIGNGELMPAAQQFVRAFNLHDKVTLHGGQPSEFVRKLMGEADIFLQHSMTDPQTGDEEGLPVAILEAMAQGLPVISTRHAGIPDAVEENATGYLVEEGDSAGMAERIVSLAQDGDLRSRMGEAAWRRAKDHFSWKRERSDLLRVLGL